MKSLFESIARRSRLEAIESIATRLEYIRGNDYSMFRQYVEGWGEFETLSIKEYDEILQAFIRTEKKQIQKKNKQLRG